MTNKINNSNSSKMKRINKLSKAGSRYLYMYEHAKVTSVKQFYKQPSSAKVLAEKECLQRMRQENGEGYKILSGGSYSFTAAWRTVEGLRIETRLSSYLVVF